MQLAMLGLRDDVFRRFGVVFRWYISVLDLGAGWDWGCSILFFDFRRNLFMSAILVRTAIRGCRKGRVRCAVLQWFAVRSRWSRAKLRRWGAPRSLVYVENYNVTA